MLSDSELKHLAKLGRIEFDEKETERLKSDLESILAYVDQLTQVDTQGIEPLYQTAGLVNAFRPDEHRNDFPAGMDLTMKLIGQAPQREGQFVKVRSVLKAK